MSQNISSRRRSAPPAAAVILVVLASLALAACGGSSTSSSSTSTATSASARTATTGRAPGALGGRFTALRECLQKNGVTLPKFTPGQRRSPGTHRSFLPKGVSRSQYEAAVKKCGGAGIFTNGRNRFSDPAIKQALAKFATCMRENGVNIPKANTSGKGPIFNSKRSAHEQRQVQSRRDQVSGGSCGSVPWCSRRPRCTWSAGSRRSATHSRLAAVSCDDVKPPGMGYKRAPGGIRVAALHVARSCGELAWRVRGETWGPARQTSSAWWRSPASGSLRRAASAGPTGRS